MALEIYYPENIKRVLDALNTAQGATTAQGLEQLEKLAESGAGAKYLNDEAKEHVTIFRAGFSTALSAVAAAFGLEA